MKSGEVILRDLSIKLEESKNNEMALLDLLSRIRFALGDNGLRMQDELVEYCKELADKSGMGMK